MKFKSLTHCRNILKFAIAYLQETGYPDQASAVGRAVVEVDQDLRSEEVKQYVHEANEKAQPPT